MDDDIFNNDYIIDEPDESIEEFVIDEWNIWQGSENFIDIWKLIL